MAPLDVTALLQVDAAGRRRIFTQLTPLTNALTLLYALWGHEHPTLHDPIAVALVFEPSLCEMEDMRIGVDAKGFIRIEAGPSANARVAVKTDPKKFIEFYLNRVAAP